MAIGRDAETRARPHRAVLRCRGSIYYVVYHKVMITMGGPTYKFDGYGIATLKIGLKIM